MESEYIENVENDCTYKNETNYKAQWSVQNQVNNWWDTRKEKSIHVTYGFSISITWTNERKLNFRWLLYFRSENIQGETELRSEP